jgi:hypothetical protein
MSLKPFCFFSLCIGYVLNFSQNWPFLIFMGLIIARINATNSAKGIDSGSIALILRLEFT